MITDILKLVADEYELSLSTLIGPDRSLEVSEARHVAMWLLRDVCHLKLIAIAKRLGRTDHTTVRYAIEKIDDKIRDEVEFAARMHRLKAQARILHRATVAAPPPAPAEPQRLPASPDRWAMWNAAMRGSAYVKTA